MSKHVQFRIEEKDYKALEKIALDYGWGVNELARTMVQECIEHPDTKRFRTISEAVVILEKKVGTATSAIYELKNKLNRLRVPDEQLKAVIEPLLAQTRLPAPIELGDVNKSPIRNYYGDEEGPSPAWVLCQQMEQIQKAQAKWSDMVMTRAPSWETRHIMALLVVLVCVLALGNLIVVVNAVFPGIFPWLFRVIGSC